MATPSADATIDELTLARDLGNYTVQAMTLIETGFSSRLAQFKAPDTEMAEKLKILSSGVWYPHSYLECLTQLAHPRTTSEARLEHLRKRNAFWAGYLNPKLWTRLGDNSVEGCQQFQFVWKDSNQSAAEEIVNILLGDSFCLLDCGPIINIAHYAAVLKVWGKERFDTCFTVSNVRYSAPCKISFYHVQNPMYCFITGVVIERDKIQVGDRVSFRNHPGYSVRHPLGAAQSWNTICSAVSSDVTQIRYCAFGFEGRELTEAQIYELFCSEYNRSSLTGESFAEGKNQRDIIEHVAKKKATSAVQAIPSSIECSFFNNGKGDSYHDQVVRLKTSAVLSVLKMMPQQACLRDLFMNLPTREMQLKALDQATLLIWGALASRDEALRKTAINKMK